MNNSFDRPVLFRASPEMTPLVAAHDWGSTALGPVARWSPALRYTVENVLANGSPQLLWWGPTFVQIYNDAYRPILGDKHPRALGVPVSECWTEVWNALEPLISQPYEGGAPSVLDDFDLTLWRRGYAEEAHFTIAYSAVVDETAANGIGGVLATVSETTERVISDRRIRLLSALAASTSEASDPMALCEVAAEVVSTDPRDIPYAAFYVFDSPLQTATLQAVTVSAGSEAPAWPKSVDARSDDQFPISQILDSGHAVLSTDDRPKVVLPILSSGSAPWGFIVAGTSERLRMNEAYLDFLELLVAPISTAFNRIYAYAAERKRAEAIAELDRTKSAFFSNVSHEFRTPLTLILGPLDELAKRAEEGDAFLVATARRNVQRLLKLVNSLLEFSRLEAGRNDATFVDTDLSKLTADVCSAFRSSIESAGLKFDVNLKLRQRVFVDRTMWEKIVSNLLSNALKFTMRGEIRVELTANDRAAELTVTDTGAGIDPRDKQRVFERFHRLKPSEARSHEGSGIGLALVQELVRLHNGDVTVESELGKGSRFRVRIPLGYAHLDQAQIGSPRPHADSGVTEQYVADLAATISSASPKAAANANARGRILVVDDNRDLQGYLTHLLSAAYDVVTADDGHDAMRKLTSQPFDLVLTDVMMPLMDGNDLIAAMQNDAALSKIPVVVISARAGDEASVEALRAGAADYVVKPFQAERLLAKLEAVRRLAEAAPAKPQRTVTRDETRLNKRLPDSLAKTPQE